MQKTSKKPVTRQAARPPLYWRNKWKAHEKSATSTCIFTGRTQKVRAHQVYLALAIWATKEQAEQKAMEVIERSKNPAIYLGPVPCDKDGNPL